MNEEELKLEKKKVEALERIAKNTESIASSLKSLEDNCVNDMGVWGFKVVIE